MNTLSSFTLRRTLYRVGWALAAALALGAVHARAMEPKCLADANDAGQIKTARIAIDSACVCSSFDGTPGKTHGDYVACAKGVIATANLRKPCKGLVKKFSAKSSCGFAAALGKVPCVKQSENTGKITCAVKPASKCVPKPPFSASLLPCDATNADWTHCIDAADTNGDLSIDVNTGDSGHCSCHAGFGDCNNNPLDGCEKSTSDDPDNCGSCAHSCIPANGASARGCANGLCQSTCPNSEIVCGAGPDGGGGGCLDASSDMNNCGSCGNVCPAGGPESCSLGGCYPWTPQRGNLTGGTDFQDFCSGGLQGQMGLTGIEGYVENGYITELAGICTVPSMTGPQSSVLPAHGAHGPTAQSFTLSCLDLDPGGTLAGFSGRSDGTHLVELTVRCSVFQITFHTNNDNTVTIDSYSLSSPVDGESTGGTGGTAFAQSDCPPGYAIADGTDIRAENAGGIDALALHCAFANVPVGIPLPAGCL